MIRRLWIGLLIVLLGAVIRLYDFGHSPAGVYLDEASHGYSAYSLLTTGRDEYGKAWPILFRSFGTYPPGLYNYLSVLPIKLMGLNVISTRVTSLIFGLLLIVIATFFVNWRLGLIVAITPIFVFISRAAFEPNVGLVLLLLGIVMFMRKRLVWCAFFLSLSAYAYPAERFLSLVLLFFLFPKHWRILLFGLALQIPLFYLSFTPAGSGRLQALSGGNPIRLYAAYFSPNNLFSKPDPDLQRSFPELSVFYWWMAPLLLFGLFKLKKIPKLILLLLVLSVIPGAITKDYFSTLRVLPYFLCLAWIMSTSWPKNKLIGSFLLVIAVVELYSNLVLLKHERSTIWNFEYAKLSEFMESRPNDHFVVDNSRAGPSYILYAFYSKTHLPDSQKTRSDYYSHINFDNKMDIGNASFRPIIWEQDLLSDQVLVGDLLAISDEQINEHGLQEIAVFYDINHLPALRAFATRL